MHAKIILSLILTLSSANAFFIEHAFLFTEEQLEFYDSLIYSGNCPYETMPAVYLSNYPVGFEPAAQSVEAARIELDASVKAADVKRNALHYGMTWPVMDRIATFECRSRAAAALKHASKAAKQSLAAAEEDASKLSNEVESKHASRAAAFLEQAKRTGEQVDKPENGGIGALINQSSLALRKSWAQASTKDWPATEALALTIGPNSIISNAANYSKNARKALDELEESFLRKEREYDLLYARNELLVESTRAEQLTEIQDDAGETIASNDEKTPAANAIESKQLQDYSKRLVSESKQIKLSRQRGRTSKAIDLIDSALTKLSESSYAAEKALAQSNEILAELDLQYKAKIALAKTALKASESQAAGESSFALKLINEAEKARSAIKQGSLAYKITALKTALEKAKGALAAAKALKTGNRAYQLELKRSAKISLEKARTLDDNGLDVSAEKQRLEEIIAALDELGESISLIQLESIRQALYGIEKVLLEKQRLEYAKLEQLVEEIALSQDFLDERQQAALLQARKALFGKNRLGEAVKARRALEEIAVEIESNAEKIAKSAALRNLKHAIAAVGTVKLDQNAAVVHAFSIETPEYPDFYGPLEVKAEELKLDEQPVTFEKSPWVKEIDFQQGRLVIEYSPSSVFEFTAQVKRPVAFTKSVKTTQDSTGNVKTMFTTIEFDSMLELPVEISFELERGTQYSIKGSVVSEKVVETNGRILTAIIAARKGVNKITIAEKLQPVGVVKTVNRTSAGYTVSLTLENNADREFEGYLFNDFIVLDCAIDSVFTSEKWLSYDFFENKLALRASTNLLGGEIKVGGVQVNCLQTVKPDAKSNSVEEFERVLRRAVELFESDSTLVKIAQMALKQAVEGDEKQALETLESLAQEISRQANELEKNCVSSASVSDCEKTALKTAKARGYASARELQTALTELDNAFNEFEKIRLKRQGELKEKLELMEKYSSEKERFALVLDQTEKAFKLENGKSRQSTQVKNAVSIVEKSVKYLENVRLDYLEGETRLSKYSAKAIGEQLAKAVENTAVLEEALELVRRETENQIEVAEARVKQFGNSADSAIVADAKSALEDGSLLTAQAIASQARFLGGSKHSGDFDYWLAAAGIVILSTVAYLLYRRREPKAFVET